MQILKEISSLAKHENTASVVITFDPHPKYVLNKEASDNRLLITTLEKKIGLFDQFGVDYALILQFNDELSNIKAEDFLKNVIIDNFHPHDIVIGYDHHFGHNRRGNLQLLSKSASQYKYRVDKISAVKYDGELVSSTKIRKFLLSGDIDKVNQLLGWEYEISGTVVIGDGRGRQIDFPTANIEPYEKKQIIPKNGVYKVSVSTNGKEYDGMCNIGKQPTFNGNAERIEVNILTNDDFDLYGKSLTIKFYRFLREEKKFNNINELKMQLEKDKINCLNN